MPIRYVKIKPAGRLPTWRKIALSTWERPGSPEIYGTLEVDLTKAFRWKGKYAGVSPKVTVMHMVARAVALAMERHPDLNGYIRWRRIYIRDSVDIFFQVATEHESGKMDLTGVRIAGVNRKSVHQIAAEMADKVERARKKKDTELQKTSAIFNVLPGFIVRFLLWLVAFISYTLNIRFPGIPPDSFGGCMISNIGSLGLDVGYAPLIPFSRVPFIILLGQAKLRPVVVDGRVEVREIVTLNATIDHSFCDGSLVARMVGVVHEVFDDPDRWFGEPGAAAQ
jgi:pyruvate/2-oxoglutarate dehydrogenase complex dihydrolipoamide acyltransferase (E2) component